jgi:DNA-binding protein Fis
MVEVFSLYANVGSSQIDSRNTIAAVAALGFKISEENVLGLFRKHDTSGFETIFFKSFQELVYEIAGKFYNEDIILFLAFDSQAKGFIDLDQFLFVTNLAGVQLEFACNIDYHRFVRRYLAANNDVDLTGIVGRCSHYLFYPDIDLDSVLKKRQQKNKNIGSLVSMNGFEMSQKDMDNLLGPEAISSIVFNTYISYLNHIVTNSGYCFTLNYNPLSDCEYSSTSKLQIEKDPWIITAQKGDFFYFIELDQKNQTYTFYDLMGKLTREQYDKICSNIKNLVTDTQMADVVKNSCTFYISDLSDVTVSDCSIMVLLAIEARLNRKALNFCSKDVGPARKLIATKLLTGPPISIEESVTEYANEHSEEEEIEPIAPAIKKSTVPLIIESDSERSDNSSESSEELSEDIEDYTN